MISPREIEAAVLHTVQTSFGGSEDEITQSVARLLGFQSRSAQLRSAVTDVLTEMSRRGKIIASGDFWLLAPATKE